MQTNVRTRHVFVVALIAVIQPVGVVTARRQPEREAARKNLEHLMKRFTPPPKALAERGTELFADGDVHVLRQIDSKSKSAASVVDTHTGIIYVTIYIL